MARERTTHARGKKAEEGGFLSGLFALMTRQCIFSAMIFAAIYFLKHADFPAFLPICAAIKSAVGFNMTFDFVLGLARGLFV